MAEFYYVYMLSDVATHTHHYVGMTKDLKSRLKMHNSRQVIHTSKYAPWELDAAIAVRSKKVASELELYFKSGAGRAFANKHLFPPTLAAMREPERIASDPSVIPSVLRRPVVEHGAGYGAAPPAASRRASCP